jgi:four helix bundle protein
MLRIFEDMLVLMAALRPVCECVKKHDRDLAEQGRTALTSAGLNLGEGTGCRAGRKRNHYSIALGSMTEAKAAILIANAQGFIALPPAETMDRIDKVLATLAKLAR